MDHAVARSYLYAPADRVERFDKALASGADAVIVDLEDGVVEDSKAAARNEAERWISSKPGAPVWVRVNNRPDLLADDLAMARRSGAAGVVMPKATTATCSVEGVELLALIESAQGVLDAPALARLPHVARLALGEADLAADLGVLLSSDRRELFPIRSQVVVASAAAELPSPVGPVRTDLGDDEGLRSSSRILRSQGFGARTAIHPAQLEPINECFAPSPEESVRAEKLLRAFDAAIARGESGVIVDDEYVDAAVARRIRRSLA